MRSSIGLCVLAACLGLASPAADAAPAASGGVYVTTLPSAADVWVDGTYVGRSPVLVDALAPGRHGVTITRTGWQAQRVPIEVAGGGIAMASLRLLPTTEPGANGTFVVRGMKGARAMLDGKRVFADLSAPTAAASGRHELQLLTAHGKTTRSFVIVPHTETEVVFREVPQTHAVRAAVDAPASDYLPDDAIHVVDRRIALRYGGHQVTGRLGDPVLRYDGTPTTYESAPTQIAGRLYLPLDLLQKLAAAGDPPPAARGASPSPSAGPQN